MNAKRYLATGATSLLLALGLLTGCKSDQQKAMDQAKAQAASTNTPQQIQYIDKNGDTVTTVVNPPVAGQPQAVTTSIQAGPPGPPRAATKPVITPVGVSTQPSSSLTEPASPGYQPETETTTAASAAVAPSAGGTVAPALHLVVPAGTELAIRINQSINVKHSHAGDHFTGEVASPVVHDGTTLIPRGTPVRGRVDASHRRGHFKGSSILELRLTSLTLNGNSYELATHDNVHTKKGKGKRTAGFIGGLTGAGMLIGGLASGGVGLGIGAAAGAGAGTLLAGTTGNRDIDIPAESIQHFRLADELVIQ